MTTMEISFLVGFFILCNLASFMLGWDIAAERERRAAKYVRIQRQQIELRMRKLTTWVRENWPNEYAAWRRGHSEGYQQGVLQGPELDGAGEG